MTESTTASTNPGTLELFREPGAWRVPLSGCAVVRCSVDFAFTIAVDHPAGPVEFRIEQPFAYADRTGRQLRLDPEDDPTGLGPALAAARAVVERAVAYTDGALEIAFTDGSALRAGGSTDFEAWRLTGPGGLLVVSAAGGELAVWTGARADD
jgi:hypothetical protein